MARLLMTSLAFMLDCVPDPVCQTTREVVEELEVGNLLRGLLDGLTDRGSRTQDAFLSSPLQQLRYHEPVRASGVGVSMMKAREPAPAWGCCARGSCRRDRL